MHTVLKIILFLTDLLKGHFNGLPLSHPVGDNLKMKASSLVWRIVLPDKFCQ